MTTNSKFYGPSPFAYDDTEILNSVQLEAIKPCVKAFLSNIRRLKRLIDMPAEVVWLCLSQIEVEKVSETGEVTKVEHGYGDHRLTFFAAMSAARQQCGQVADGLLDEARSAFELMVGNTGTHFDNAIESILSSQIVGIWTAFEVLAGDLWIAAVDEHPSVLATLSGKENRILRAVGKSVNDEDGEFDEMDDTFVLLSATKTIGLNHLYALSGGTFDLSKAMGKLHVKSERIKFSSLRGIRTAYALAFPENYKGLKPGSIDRALASIALDRIALVRNMLVHNGGEADDEYASSHSIIPDCPPLKKGDRIRLDIGMVNSIVEPVLKSSLDLIQAVDKWMAATSKMRV